MTELVINISRVDPKFQKPLKSTDKNKNGKIDTDEEVTAAANLLCEDKPKNLAAAGTCLRKTIGIETSNALITWEPSLFQPMDRHESASWEIANRSNGNPFNTTWRPSNIKFEKGLMKLVLNNTGCPQTCDGKPYASGEYRTKRENFGYGYYEVRMKAARGEGLVAGSFFTYRGVSEQPSHDEIDFEFLGKDTTKVQTNYYARGKGKHEEMIDLSFDASKEFHNYGFKLTPNSLTWYVDGKPVRTAAASPGEKLPYRPAKIMANFWPGTSESDIVAWLGSFKYPGRPLQVEYDWIKYSPLSAGTEASKPAQPTPPAPEEPAKEKTKPGQPAEAKPKIEVSSSGALPIKTIRQSTFALNKGVLRETSDTFVFSANRAKDPRFGIITGDVDIKGRKNLMFEIKGSLTKLGTYARFIAQVYNETDNEYSPSISLESVKMSDHYETVSVDLEDKINRVKKIQFLMVTDNGSCRIEIKNLRFE